MYWFSRPPYLRYGAAVLILAAGLYAEFKPDRYDMHPFAAADISAGTLLTEDLFEPRRVLSGSLPLVVIEGMAARDMALGEPLMPTAIADGTALAPDGWWALEVAMPADVAPASQVRVVVRPHDPAQSPVLVPGVVIAPAATADHLSLDTSLGVVAVPEEHAATVAVAAADRRITVLIDP